MSATVSPVPTRRRGLVWLIDNERALGYLLVAPVVILMLGLVAYPFFVAIGYALSDRVTADLAVSGLRTAIARRSPVGTVIVHSDRGSQFRARKFVAVLKANKLSGSMGRVAAAGDNAAMESFFALLQKNVLDHRRWATRDELRIAIVTWIERTYHRRRRQAALGRLTPIEYETIITAPATQAA